MSERLDRLLLFSLRRPAMALGLVALLTAGALAALLTVGIRVDVRVEKVFPERDARIAVYQEFQRLFGRDDETAFCLLELPGSVLEVEALERIHALSEGLRELPLVDWTELTSLTRATFVRVQGDEELEVGPFYEPRRRAGWDPAAMDAVLRDHPLFADRLISRDRRLAGFLIPMARSEPGERSGPARRAFVEELRGFFAANLEPGERVHLDGFAVTYDTVLRFLTEDTLRFFSLALVLLLLTLWLVFRRLLPTLLAVATVVTSVVWTFGSMALLDVPFTYIATGIPVMVLVVCVGDTVHLVARFYQRLGAGDAKRPALEAALRDIGRSCLYTSVTTATGFLALLTSQVELIRELGLPVALGVLYAYLITMLLVPPVLAWAPAPPPGALAGGLRILKGPLERLAAGVARRPGAIALGAAALALASLALAPGISQENRLLQEFDDDRPIMVTRAFFEAKMGGVAPLEVLIDAGAPGRALEPEVVQGLLDLGQRLREERFRAKGVLFSLSAADLLSDAYYTFFERLPEYHGALPDDGDALAQLRFLYSMGNVDPTRELLDDVDAPQVLRLQLRLKNLYTTELFELVEAIEEEARAHLPPWVGVRITGASLMSQAVHATMVGDLALSFGTALLCVTLLTLLLFRSPRLALLSLLPNLFPLTILLAFMALSGIALSTSTSIVFAVVFGICVDDTIHFVAALAEKRRMGDPDPIGATIRQTGLALTLSSIVLGLGFLVLWFSNFRANRYFGLLVAMAAVLALLADLVLLPALLHLTRRRRARDTPAADRAGGEPGPALSTPSS